MSAPTIEEILASPRLPSLPKVAVDVLELTRNKDVQIEAIAEVVQNDPALSAKILKTVNSPFYNLAAPCPTISRALGYLGLSTVKSLVLGFSLVKSTECDEAGFDLTEYWRRCLFSAAAARKIALECKSCDEEEAFTAALMQDLGMLAIHTVAAEEYASIVANTHGDHRRLPRLEQEFFGFDHAVVGGHLAERWNLPPQLVAAIRHHHDNAATEHRKLAQTIVLSAETAAAMNLSNPGAAIAHIREEANEWFGLDGSGLSSLLMQITEDTKKLGKMFAVNTGELPDINWILSEAAEASVNAQIALQQEADTLRRSNDELAKIAVTDGLTNVGNRKRFDEELLTRFDQARSFNGTLGLIIADADHFKSFNDTHGHQAGDAVLIEIANRLKGAVRGVDLVCRYGGEEFAAILPGASIKDVAMIAERLRLAIADAPFDLMHVPQVEKVLTVTASFGAAVLDAETSDVISAPSVLIKAADKALYAAKEGGRNCVRVFRLDRRSSAA